MYVQHNNVACSLNRCCRWNAIMFSLFTDVDMYVAANSTKPLALSRKRNNRFPCYCCRATKYFVLLSTTQMHLGLQVKCPTFLSDINHIFNLQQVFLKLPNINFHEILPCGGRANPCAKTDRPADIMQPIGTFCCLWGSAFKIKPSQIVFITQGFHKEWIMRRIRMLMRCEWRSCVKHKIVTNISTDAVDDFKGHSYLYYEDNDAYKMEQATASAIRTN
jgi:hypothetical protein